MKPVSQPSLQDRLEVVSVPSPCQSVLRPTETNKTTWQAGSSRSESRVRLCCLMFNFTFKFSLPEWASQRATPRSSAVNCAHGRKGPRDILGRRSWGLARRGHLRFLVLPGARVPPSAQRGSYRWTQGPLGKSHKLYKLAGSRSPPVTSPLKGPREAGTPSLTQLVPEVW